jgi:hypothetical protein
VVSEWFPSGFRVVSEWFRTNRKEKTRKNSEKLGKTRKRLNVGGFTDTNGATGVPIACLWRVSECFRVFPSVSECFRVFSQKFEKKFSEILGDDGKSRKISENFGETLRAERFT